jgi:hypothetical protein
LESSIEPPKQVGVGAEARDTFVFDSLPSRALAKEGRQHRAADHDLPTRVAPSLGAARQRRQTVSRGAQPGEALVKSFEARANLLRRRRCN